MPGPWVNWLIVKNQVAAELHVTTEELAPEWDVIISRATKTAQERIYTILANKGYSASQIDAADQAPVWHEDLAVFFAMVKGTSLMSYPLDSVKEYDCRKELQEVGVILIGGQPVPPDGTNPVGSILHGQSNIQKEIQDELVRKNYFCS